MKNQRTLQGLLLALVLLAGTVVFSLLYQFDNKYTAALPGGYGYNVLPEDADRVAFLVDGWEYYPGRLLEPSDFADGVTPAQYTYIGEYPNFSEQLGSPYGTATYRLLLAGSDTPVQLALYLPELLCAGRIYVDGALVGTQGSLEPYAPRIMDRLYTIEVTGTTEIIIQCANYTHYYSGLYYPPAIGSLEAVTGMLVLRLVVYGFLCFSALAVALFHLVQWLPGRDRLTRQMGVLGLAFALRVLYPFVRALGIPSVRPLYALEDLSGNVVLLCAILLAGALSGCAQRRYHRCAAVPMGVGLCLVTVIFPLFILPYAPACINLYGLLLFLLKLAAGLYLLFLSSRAFVQDRALGCYLVCAAGLYGLSVAITVLMANRFEPICGAWPEEYGAFCLAVSFSALMVRRGVLLIRENRRLTEHLQEEVARKTQGLNTLAAERRKLLADLLHDLKNPLSALRNYAELVCNSHVALDPETDGYLRALIDRVDAVGDRFEVLRDFSRGEQTLDAPAVIALHAFLRSFYESNRPDLELSGLSFRLELPAESAYVRGSEERLRLALENLCYNAASFTPPDGVITLGLTLEETTAVITVQDTGTGIAPEHLPYIFERGYTSRGSDGGEGLGLYHVRMIALEHGGTVEAASQPGKGSRFTLRLPLEQFSHTAAPPDHPVPGA